MNQFKKMVAIDTPKVLHQLAVLRYGMVACRLMAEDAVDAAIDAGGLRAERGCVTDHLPLVGAEKYSTSLFAHLAQVRPHRHCCFMVCWVAESSGVPDDNIHTWVLYARTPRRSAM